MGGGVTDNYARFMGQVSAAVEHFNAIPIDACIRLVTHLDADGITACAMLVRALTDLRRPFSISVVKQLTKPIVQDLGREPFDHYLFTDIGSCALSWIEEEMSAKHSIIILDHHEQEKPFPSTSNIISVNPHNYRIDGDTEIAGAGVAYLFVRALNPNYRCLAHLAIVGAIAERQEYQEQHGFSGLNKMILQEAIEAGALEMHIGLRCFGFQSKPLHKLLEQSYNPRIPGVTGSEEGALAFLSELGLAPQRNNTWRKLSELTSAEAKQLIQGIIARRAMEKEPEDVWGCTYLLSQELDDSFRDAREFATLLNACGRLGHAILAINVCLGDVRMKQQVLEAQAEYKKELQQALAWLRQHRYSRHIIEEEGFIIINFEDTIRPTILGTLVSMLTHKDRFPSGTFILGLAQDYDGMTKASLRVVGSADSPDARVILRHIMNAAGGDCGGHKTAAGGIFPTAKEAYFLEAAKDVLRKTLAYLP